MVLTEFELVGWMRNGLELENVIEHININNVEYVMAIVKAHDVPLQNNIYPIVKFWDPPERIEYHGNIVPFYHPPIQSILDIFAFDKRQLKQSTGATNIKCTISHLFPLYREPGASVFSPMIHP